MTSDGWLGETYAADFEKRKGEESRAGEGVRNPSAFLELQPPDRCWPFRRAKAFLRHPDGVGEGDDVTVQHRLAHGFEPVLAEPKRGT